MGRGKGMLLSTMDIFLFFFSWILAGSVWNIFLITTTFHCLSMSFYVTFITVNTFHVLLMVLSVTVWYEYVQP